MKTINILGTKYKIIYEDFGESKRSAYCDVTNKEIHIDNKYAPIYIKHSTRHEIIHAFFFECGLEDYFYDETITSFIALQFDKIEKLFKDVLGND